MLDGNGKDIYGFSAFPGGGGRIMVSGLNSEAGDAGNWWSFDERSKQDASYWGMRWKPNDLSTY